MTATRSDSAPQMADDPTAELASLIDRSLLLQTEALEINKRIKELNQQVAQQHAEGDVHHHR